MDIIIEQDESPNQNLPSLKKPKDDRFSFGERPNIATFRNDIGF
jgi:hypothetical protein